MEAGQEKQTKSFAPYQPKYNLSMEKVIFLDRDGVIIENRPHYVTSWHEVKFIDGSIEAIAALTKAAYQIFIITNQSGINRGIIPLQTANEISQRINKTIQQNGGRITDVFMCPHTPEDNCNCRKPKPGLLLAARDKYKINLQSSILIGDALTDLQAGINAGVGRVILVKTGRGQKEEQKVRVSNIKYFEIFNSLLEATNAILQQQNATYSSSDIPTPKNNN